MHLIRVSKSTEHRKIMSLYKRLRHIEHLNSYTSWTNVYMNVVITITRLLNTKLTLYCRVQENMSFCHVNCLESRSQHEEIKWYPVPQSNIYQASYLHKEHDNNILYVYIKYYTMYMQINNTHTHTNVNLVCLANSQNLK